MEDVLKLYTEGFDSLHPVICFDETSKQMVRELRVAIPASCGQVERIDYEYKRNGVANLFMMCQPKGGWRHVEVTDRHTKLDFADQMKYLVDEAFPAAEKIRVVMDNLSTHSRGALYDRFSPIEASRILQKLEFHFTPKHASWLNMAEIELSVLARQCLSRRMADKEILKNEVKAWEENRNQSKSEIQWKMTVDMARHKLKRHYPSISNG